MLPHNPQKFIMFDRFSGHWNTKKLLELEDAAEPKQKTGKRNQRNVA